MKQVIIRQSKNDTSGCPQYFETGVLPVAQSSTIEDKKRFTRVSHDKSIIGMRNVLFNTYCYYHALLKATGRSNQELKLGHHYSIYRICLRSCVKKCILGYNPNDPAESDDNRT